MMKFLLSLVILTLTATVGFAQEQPTGMRDLAVNQMFDYGRTLYERGDKTEARNVFERILQLNPDYAPAQKYAEELGIIRIAHLKVVKKQEVVIIKKIEPVIIDPNQDLKDQIAMEEQSIAQLSSEVAVLRADVNAQIHE